MKTTLLGWTKGLLIIGTAVFHAVETGAFTGLHGLALAFGVLTVISGSLTQDKTSDTTDTNAKN